MKNFFKTLSRLSMATLGGTLILIMLSVAIALCGIGLAGLYLVKYVDGNAPEVKALSCWMGLRHDCPDDQKELHDLQGKIDAAEKKLALLRAVESKVSSITLFTNHTDPSSNRMITVGTVYRKLLEPDAAPEYFCYILLDAGIVQEQRNLHFRDAMGDIALNADTFRQAGITDETMRYARSVCQPLLIGG